MDDSMTFVYTYSAPMNQEVQRIRKKYLSQEMIKRRDKKMNQNDQELLVEKIRTQYVEKEHTQLDELKALDKKVKKPANVFAYVFGTIGALVMGTGMTLTMDVIQPGTYFGITIGESTMMIGIFIGIVGMAMALANYPIYKKMLESRRKKYADQIMKLSDAIMKGTEK